MTNTNKIPFLDSVTLHRELKEELSSVVGRALETAGFIGGPMVEEFERDFAAYCTTQHCVGVGSGTDALRFALIAAGIGPGAIVPTVPNTFIATTEAITQAGARPDFIDIDEQTYNMDPRNPPWSRAGLRSDPAPPSWAKSRLGKMPSWEPGA